LAVVVITVAVTVLPRKMATRGSFDAEDGSKKTGPSLDLKRKLNTENQDDFA